MLSRILQSSYVELLNEINNKLKKRITEKTRDKIIFVMFIIFSIYFLVFRSSFFYNRLALEHDICEFFGGLLLFVVVIMSIKEEVKVVQWRTSLSLTLLLFASFVVGIGLMHSIGYGYGFFGLKLLTIYPCLYIVWNNREDYEKLFDKISIAFIITGMGYFVWFAYMDYTDSETVAGARHLGGMANANFVSFIGLIICCSALYCLYRSIRKKRKSSIEISFFATAIITGSVLIAKGASRTAILVVVANAFIVAFFLIKNSEKKNAKKMGVVIGAILIVLMIVIIVIGVGRESTFLERFDFTNKDANQFTSGRIDIWGNYATRLNLLGHDMSEVDYDVLTNNITWHAHNTFLEYGYRCGVLTGMFCILFQLIAGIITLSIMFSKRGNRDYEVFVVIFTVHYLIMSLLDIATIPMTNYGAFFFYICVAPLFKKDEAKEVI